MLDSLPDAARVWLFPLDGTPGTPDGGGALLADLRAWLPTWSSHGRPVRAAADLVADRALAVGAVISAEDLNAGVSGCGIDAMRHAVDAVLARHGVGLAPALAVTYRDAAGAWQTVPRPAFRRLVRDGAAGAGTAILDGTAETVGALRRHGAERPAGETWAGRAFGLGPVAA